MRLFRISLATIALVALAGCATVPKPLAGEYGSASPREGAVDGNRVRWGGDIVDVRPGPNETCFQILSRRLDVTSRPRRYDEGSDGRFLACRSGFYDPAIFDKGRELTVTGTVTGSETVKIGEYDYRLPRVAADVVYLWPERYSFDGYYPSPAFYYNPWFGPPLIRYHYYPRPHHHHHRPRDRDRD